MKFQILCLATQALLRDQSGALVLFEEGKDATAKAKELTEAQGTKWQPRKIKQGNWRKREAQRLIDGSYTPLPWINEYWINPSLDHFAHVSQKFPDKVSFTLNETNGDRDIQTAMRAGRYLSKFYGKVLNVPERNKWVMKFAALHEDNKLLFAMTEDEITEIYTSSHGTGANSCMSYPENHWISSAGFHPVRIYAAGDLSLAYLVSEGRISARAMVWPEKKTYSRAYGDVGRIESLLEQMGYTSSPPIGAKLLLRTNKQGVVVAPYVDKAHASGGGQLAVKVDGDHLVICDGNTKDSSYSDYETGLTSLVRKSSSPSSYYNLNEDEDDEDDDDYIVCEHCGDSTHPDNTREVYRREDRNNEDHNNAQQWCQSCAENYAHPCCDFDDRLVRRNSTVLMEGGAYYWTSWHFHEHGSCCEHSGNNYPRSTLRRVRTREGTRLWCVSSLDDHADICDITKELYSLCSLVELPDGRLVGFDTEIAQEFETGSYRSRDPDQQELVIDG